MPEFTASDPGSSFPNQNILFNSAAGITGQQIQHNQLGLQAQQLDLTAADHEQVGRLAAGLLNEPDLAKRADLYARGVGMLQAQNLAKYAPPTLPDESTLRSLVNQSVPVTDQIKMGLYTPPGLTEALARASAPPPWYGGATAPGSTTGAAAPATGGGPSFAGGIAGFESGGTSNPPENPRWPVAKGGPAGPHQFIASTWNQFAQANPDLFKGMTPDQILAARTDTTPVGPNGEDRSTLATNWYAGENAKALQANNIQPTPANLGIAHALGAGGATKVLSAPDNTPLSQVIPETIPQNPQYGRMTVGDLKRQYSRLGPVGGGTAIATTTPPTAQPGQPVPTQIASSTPMVSTAPPATTAATAQPGQPQPAAAPAATAQPGATPLPGTGVNSQQFQTALWKTQQAALLETQFPNSPAAKAKAAELRAEAALYMQADSVITLPNGIQVKALSGQQIDAAKPLPHYVYDAAQHAYIDTTGTNKPEFEPAQRDSAVAQRDVMELGPKVANGTATQAEQARYATAVETYRQPVLRENPVSKETVRVNTRELPAGFPEPPSLGGGGAPGGAGTGTPGGSNVVIQGLSPQQQQIERNKGRYDIAVEDLKHDRGEINAISDAGRGAQQDNLRVKEMQDILQHVDTGPGTENAAKFRAWIARWMPGELSRWDGSGANLSNPAAIEMFQKLGFVGAVTQERGSTPRGGYQATKMFQQFNPGAQLLTSSNQGLLAQRLIANQAEADYAQGAQDHYNTQRERLKSPEQDYEPLSSFDAKWQAQRNPQVYAAAIGALGGQDPEMWARGLSKDEIQRVKDVVTRADPNAVIHMPGEGKIVLQPNAKPLPPGFKVQ